MRTNSLVARTVVLWSVVIRRRPVPGPVRAGALLGPPRQPSVQARRPPPRVLTRRLHEFLNPLPVWQGLVLELSIDRLGR